MADGRARLSFDLDVTNRAQAAYENAYVSADQVRRSVESSGAALSQPWQAGASTIYQGRLQDWCAQYQRVVTALGGMRDALQVSSKRLTTAVQQAESDASGS